MASGLDNSVLRFLEAQVSRFASRALFDNALHELGRGRTRTRGWTCVVFPSLSSDLMTCTIQTKPTKPPLFYSLRSYREAKAYYSHPVLGPRLEVATQTALDSGERDVLKLFGGNAADVAQFKSCLTLFATVERGRDASKHFFQDAARTFWRDLDEDTLRAITDLDDYDGPPRRNPRKTVAPKPRPTTPLGYFARQQRTFRGNVGSRRKPGAASANAINNRHGRKVEKHTKRIETWEISTIVASRVNSEGNLRYQVGWRDGRDDGDLWYRPASIKYAAKQLVTYHDENPDQPGPPCRLDAWYRSCLRGILPPNHSDDDKPCTDRVNIGRKRKWSASHLSGLK